MLSANEDLFYQAKPLYQDALKKSKYTHDLKFEEEMREEGQKGKGRKRQIIWWNPPYSMNVKTNIGARFLSTNLPPVLGRISHVNGLELSRNLVI